jgi:hypothetical protein
VIAVIAVIESIMNPNAEKKDLDNRKFEKALEEVALLGDRDKRVEAMVRWRETFTGADEV